MLLQQAAKTTCCPQRKSYRIKPFVAHSHSSAPLSKRYSFVPHAQSTPRTGISDAPARTSSSQTAPATSPPTISYTPTISSSQVFLTMGIIGGLVLLAADSASASELAGNAATYHPQEVGQLAEEQEFWGNVLRYTRYFFTVTTGGLYVLAKPFLQLFKKPTTAVLAVILGVGGVYLLRFTLNAMLGIDEPFEYTPGSPVTYGASPYMGNYQ